MRHQAIALSNQNGATGMGEGEAIRLACRGNASAFEYLYRLHSGRVYAVCLRLAGNPADAEDLTQEAFLQLFRKIQTFRGDSKFSTWMHRLTVNLVLMRLRKKRYAEVSLDATVEFGEEEARPAMEIGGPDPQLSGLVDHVNLDRAIEQLPTGYREMFILHDIEGYEHQEIAQILGRAVGTSKSQLSKARQRLRAFLGRTGRGRARANGGTARAKSAPPPKSDRSRLRCGPDADVQQCRRNQSRAAVLDSSNSSV